MNERERQIRERAYYLWEEEGRPQGRAHIHWVMAEIATAILSRVGLAQQRRISMSTDESAPSDSPP